MKILGNYADPFIGKVHQDIPAENNIHGLGIAGPQGMKFFGEVEVGEVDHFPDPRKNLMPPFAHGMKILFFQPWRTISERPLGVNSRFCFMQRPGIYIGGQNLNFPFLQIRN